MFRTLVYSLTLLHLGPGLAFVLLAFGCEDQSFSPVCSMGVFKSFALLTLGAWVVLGTGALAVHFTNLARTRGSPPTALRFRALAALLLFGCLVGASVQALTGSQLFYLAVPVALAAGWLFIANPQECTSA